ncbi:hypothetical protein MKW94_008383 [Papaver nudicaule]|uniref:Phytocyanin domain-containing protein n=1 Tax=Papaver nudicaule TaxID=74823 RepID=A0AA41RTR1_PAPNU|nr:hypothetical protein [Papaver nudicaule]
MRMNTQVWFAEAIVRLLIVLSVSVSAASATNYTVGEAFGWALEADVQDWCASKSFSVGDNLVFMYKPVMNVLEVNESAYNDCNLDNPISVTGGTLDIVNLDAPGTRYFICGTQGHCSLGMKVRIVVKDRKPKISPRPSPRRSPPPSSNTTNTTPSTPNSPPNDVPPSAPKASPSTAAKIPQKLIISLVSVILVVIN